MLKPGIKICVCSAAIKSSHRDQLPTSQLLCDQLCATPFVVSVHDGRAVLWIGAPVNTGGPRVCARGRLRTSREVPGRAIGGLQQDFTRPVQLRYIRVPGPFSLPIIENARRLLPLLHRFAPVSRRQAASSCHARPRSSRAPSRSREIRIRLGGRLLRTARRQGELPPQALDAFDAPSLSIAFRSFWLMALISEGSPTPGTRIRRLVSGECQARCLLAEGLCISVITQICSWNWPTRRAHFTWTGNETAVARAVCDPVQRGLMNSTTRNEHSRTSTESCSAAS